MPDAAGWNSCAIDGTKSRWKTKTGGEAVAEFEWYSTAINRHMGLKQKPCVSAGKIIFVGHHHCSVITSSTTITSRLLWKNW